MKKVSLFLSLMMVATIAYATDTSRVTVQGTIDDGTTQFVNTGATQKSFTTGARQIQSISATANSFTNIAVPSGAKGIIFDLGSEDQNLVLKGVTADTGISLDSTFNLAMPISSDNNTTFGVKNNSGTTRVFTVYWM